MSDFSVHRTVKLKKMRCLEKFINILCDTQLRLYKRLMISFLVKQLMTAIGAGTWEKI